MTVKERVIFIIENEKISENKLATLANVSPQLIYDATSKGKVSLNTLNKIHSALPRYSKSWLLDGVGLWKAEENEAIPAKEVFSSLKDEIKFLKEEIVFWRETARNLSAHLGKLNPIGEPAIYHIAPIDAAA